MYQGPIAPVDAGPGPRLRAPRSAGPVPCPPGTGRLSGVCIPIGLPRLIVIGYLLWKDADNAAVDEGDDNLSDEDDAAPLPAPAGANSSADD